MHTQKCGLFHIQIYVENFQVYLHFNCTIHPRFHVHYEHFPPIMANKFSCSVSMNIDFSKWRKYIFYFISSPFFYKWIISIIDDCKWKYRMQYCFTKLNRNRIKIFFMLMAAILRNNKNRCQFLYFMTPNKAYGLKSIHLYAYFLCGFFK